MSRSGILVVLACLAPAMLIAGCQTASLEDAAPKTAGTQRQTNIATDNDIRIISPIPLPARKVEKLQRQQFVEDRVAQSGQYPNIGLDREGAMQQMSDNEAQALEREFAQYRGKGKRAATDAEYRRRLAELRKTAREHAEETEKEILK
ncbi:MAG: hypothetical protein CML30_08355 [Rhizobiales bacterium]|nr:hypothetical protein [Hyphomicrobiales bacterium]|tara:strand:- start:149 stop:592 length:444 start_codon:yes stop_codon:yes gene_type:complete